MEEDLVKVQGNEIHLDITELRAKKRPLWMTDLGVEDFGDFIGAGADVWNDRIPPGWAAAQGAELTDEEEARLGPIELSEEQVRSGPGMEPESQRQAALGAKVGTEARVSGLSEKVGIVAGAVKNAAETATETVSGLVDTVKGIFMGRKKPEEKQ